MCIRDSPVEEEEEAANVIRCNIKLSVENLASKILFLRMCNWTIIKQMNRLLSCEQYWTAKGILSTRARKRKCYKKYFYKI